MTTPNTQLAAPPQRVSALNIMGVLSYDSESGVFRWLKNHGQRGRIGNIAGSVTDDGYMAIGINGKTHKSHRLAWLFYYGEDLPNTIDHINGNRADNRISNLRLATKMENARNSKRKYTNKSGIKGVSWHKREMKWRAQICVNYKVIWLGSFSTIEEAADAYASAAKQHHGEFSRTY